MSVHQSVSPLEVIQAPWNKEVSLDEVVYEGGFKMVRLRIKEGRRFTDLELDPETAARLSAVIGAWASGAQAESS